jgi:hypothetical protein
MITRAIATHLHVEPLVLDPRLVVPHDVHDLLAVAVAELGQRLDLPQVPIPVSLPTELPLRALDGILHPIHPAPHVVHLPETGRKTCGHHKTHETGAMG